MMNTLVVSKEMVLKRLEKGGIRPSLQRIAIMKYLLEHRTHPSVDEVYNSLAEEIPTLSRTTVYNTLEEFHRKGIVLSIVIDDRMTHYDGYTHAHSHFLCSKCKKIYDVDQTITIPQDTIPDGFEITESYINYVGVCKSCLDVDKN